MKETQDLGNLLSKIMFISYWNAPVIHAQEDPSDYPVMYSVDPLVVTLFQEWRSWILAAAIVTCKLAHHDCSHVHVCDDSLFLDREFSCCQ